MVTSLCPFVYWSQTENSITLRVDLKDVDKSTVDLQVEKNKFSFTAYGRGARGANTYKFNLLLNSNVISDKCYSRITDSEVLLTLHKVKASWWPRLTGQPQKPAWLKIDFERWQSDFDPDDESESARDVFEDYPDLLDEVQKQELGYRKESFKKTYLGIYNLFQFVGFSYIMIVLSIKYYKDGPESMIDTYELAGPVLKFCQLLQFLEVMHPMFNYTKGDVLTPFLQVSGRAFILFCMIESEERMQKKPVIFYLFIVWTMIELIRYPYYLTQLYKVHNSLITWLRYTLWIPLYPLGFLCEGVIIIRNIPYFEETQKYTVSLPNDWNFAFHFPTLLRVYMLLFYLPVMYFMMTHMYKARVKKLSPKTMKNKM